MFDKIYKNKKVGDKCEYCDWIITGSDTLEDYYQHLVDEHWTELVSSILDANGWDDPENIPEILKEKPDPIGKKVL